MTPRTDPVRDIEALVGHRRRFLRFVERRVASREDAEDVLQAVLAKSITRGSELRRGESVLAWFYRSLRNAITDHYRRRGARRRALARLPRDHAVEPGVDRRLEQNPCRCVLAELDDLKPAYAELLRRVEMEGRPLAQVATELGLRPGNARVRLHRARTTLRARVERTCGACAGSGCWDCPCPP